MRFLSISVLFACASMSYATPVEHMQKTDNLTNHTISSIADSGLVTMSDEELSQTQGQALMNLTTTKSTDQGLDFYRLGMEAQIDINANIKKLQLGCGGFKGDGCDIDIDNVALTGIDPIDGEYAASDAKITNPFIEFAIKGNGKSSTREIAGFRFGALEVLGKLSLGSNKNTSSISDDTGINSISGDMVIQLKNARIQNIDITCLVPLVCGFAVPSTTALVTDKPIPLILNRTNQVADIGPLEANATAMLLGFLPLKITLSNTHLVNQPAKAIHEILLQDGNGGGTKDFSLSLQNQDINWPSIASSGTFRSIAAEKGWWLSLPEVTIQSPVITERIAISLSSALASLVLDTPINISGIDFGQSPAKNCYGSLKFC